MNRNMINNLLIIRQVLALPPLMMIGERERVDSAEESMVSVMRVGVNTTPTILTLVDFSGVFRQTDKYGRRLNNYLVFLKKVNYC